MKILVSEEEIRARVAQLAQEIDECYRGREFTVISLVTGAMFFTVDLCRCLKGDFVLDSLAVSSYADEHSTGELTSRGKTKFPAAGREILLVDDVLDTGLTLSLVRAELLNAGAASVRIAVLAQKPGRRHAAAAGLEADWVGFRLPDEFLVGCGMDINEKCRQLPYIAALEPRGNN